MKTWYLAGLLALAPIQSALAGDVMDAGTWYATTYAPHWENPAEASIEDYLAAYADTIGTHGADGPATVNTREWLEPLLAQWQEEGWVSSTLDGMALDSVNPGTAVIKARWRDVYQDAPEGFSCGWYLADLHDGQWQISHFADLDCADMPE